MDISLHDAAEFMRNSQMNKDNIVTSNLTVLDNALLDINKVYYKTSNIYNTDVHKYPPVDLSSSNFLTSVSSDSNTITTQVSNQSYGNGLYKFMSSETINVEQHNSISFNVFNDTEIWDSQISNPDNNGIYDLLSLTPYIGSHSLNNDDEFKGLWFSLELPYEIVLTGIEFTKTNSEVTSFYCKIYIQDLDSNYVLIKKGNISSSNNYYKLIIPNYISSNKYFVIFQSVQHTSPRTYLNINNFRFLGYSQSNITTFQNILQSKQDTLTTTVFMKIHFHQYTSQTTPSKFTLNRLPYKFIGETESYPWNVIQPYKYRIFDVSIVDNENQNLIYSYIVNISTHDQYIGNYSIIHVPVFSYFSTSTVTTTRVGYYSIQFGDWATIRLQRTEENDDDECSVEIHKNCTVNIVSR